jgi:hypothetical protein
VVEVARFFDAVTYGETDQAEVQARFRPTGVLYEVGSRLAVSAPGGMFVSVADGEAMVEGFHYKNTTAKTLAIAANVSGSTRYDLIVLRLDRTANSLTAVVKQGTPGAGSPALTQVVGGTWEFLLASVTVASGTLSITSGLLSDGRAYGKIIHNASELGLSANLGTYAGVQRRVLTTDGSGGLYFDENAPGRKNYLQNTTFRVNQRALAIATASTDRPCDRWMFVSINNTPAYTANVAGTYLSLSGVGSEASNTIAFTRGNSTAIATDTFISLRTEIEGTEMQHIFGMPMVLSFWVLSTKAGTFGVNLEQAGTNWRYLATFTVNTPNIMEFKTIQIPWSNSGTWLLTNTVSAYLRFVVSAGSTYTAGSANAWLNTGLLAAAGLTNPLTATSDSIYIGAPKLEIGTLATRWEAPDYDTELRAAMRYLYCEQPGTILPSNVYNTSNIIGVHTFPTVMRTNPSFALNITPVFTNGGAPASNGVSHLCQGLYTTGMTYSSWTIYIGGSRYFATLLTSTTASGNIVAGQAGMLFFGSGVRALFSAEL